jgi:UDPglucose--hexose-1-phosphate uridylyltransferase
VSAHADWIGEILPRHADVDENNIDAMLRDEVSQVFVEVLEDAGVFKRDDSGTDAFGRFIDSLNA